MVDNPVVGVSAHGRRRRRNMSKTRSRCIHHSAHGRNPGTRKREQMSFWHATCASGPVSMLERGAGNCKRLGGVSRRASALGTPVACLNRPASRSRPRGCSRFTYRRELEVLTATLGKGGGRLWPKTTRRARRTGGGRAGGIIEPTAEDPPGAVTETDSRGVPPRARHGRRRAPRARGGDGRGRPSGSPKGLGCGPARREPRGRPLARIHPWPKPS